MKLIKNKKAFITGINGQDGSYLAELLLKKNYKVYGSVRRSSTYNLTNIKHLEGKIDITYLDINDQSALIQAFNKVKPNEIYNLAAQSFVKTSFDQPLYTCETTGIGALKVLEAYRLICPEAKFYQASSSEMFGISSKKKQDEKTKFNPVSPYGIAKNFAHNMVVNYRQCYNLHACCGILFNHESPRRGAEFVTQKIIISIKNIIEKKQKKLEIGNLNSYRDWGYSPEYVEAMWLMLQQDEPEEFVIGTGKTFSIKEFCKIAFDYYGLNFEDYVVENNKFLRPLDVNYLCANITKASNKLNWIPKTKFKDLIHIMISNV